MAADVIPGPSRTNTVAENGGLDRLMVSSRRDDLDFAREGGKLASKGNKYISRRAVLTAECSGGGGARAKHDRFC
jgi:hypothetical protein